MLQFKIIDTNMLEVISFGGRSALVLRWLAEAATTLGVVWEGTRKFDGLRVGTRDKRVGVSPMHLPCCTHMQARVPVSSQRHQNNVLRAFFDVFNFPPDHAQKCQDDERTKELQTRLEELSMCDTTRTRASSQNVV